MGFSMLALTMIVAQLAVTYACSGAEWQCGSDPKKLHRCVNGRLFKYPCSGALVCVSSGNSANCGYSTGGGGGGGGGGSKPKPNPNPAPQPNPQPGPTAGGGGSGEAFCTYDEFKAALAAFGRGYPTPTKDQYDNCVNQARSAGGITTKREFAMFLTHIVWESDGLRAKEEYACKVTKCPGSYKHAQDCPGGTYYGRGYIQLSWSYNYRKASKALFNGDEMKLCKNPELVAQSEKLAWGTAFWYWKDNVHVVAAVRQGKFGSSTNAINGALECRGAYQSKARERFRHYKNVLKALHVNDAAIEGGCYN